MTMVRCLMNGAAEVSAVVQDHGAAVEQEGMAMTRANIHRIPVNTKSSGTKVLWLNENETLCKQCKGKGRWDSCFECGNRGYIVEPRTDD